MSSSISPSFPSIIGSHDFLCRPIATQPKPSKSTFDKPTKSEPTKPKRPLTAYHIFFQIEREYIIQTGEAKSAAEDNDDDDTNKETSAVDTKVYLSNMPRRYKSIRLNPDWYYGPGKRQKRKHRKSHGKIGFFELSRVISARWAMLDEVDPETRAFVQRIADGELEIYRREMLEYKESVKGTTKSSSSLSLENYVSPSSSPTSSVAPSSSQSPSLDGSSVESDRYCRPTLFENSKHNLTVPDKITSYGSNSSDGSVSSCSDESSTDEICQFISHINKTIDDAGYYSANNNDILGKRKLLDVKDDFDYLSYLDPILDFPDFETDSSYFFVDEHTATPQSTQPQQPPQQTTMYQQPSSKKQRSMSPASVLDTCDDEIMQFWCLPTSS